MKGIFGVNEIFIIMPLFSGIVKVSSRIVLGDMPIMSYDVLCRF